MDGLATFSLFVRTLPNDFQVTSADVDDFASALHRPSAALSALRGMTFTGEVRAVPERRVVFSGEPLLDATAPIAQAQLVETFLLKLWRPRRCGPSWPRQDPGGRLLPPPLGCGVRLDSGDLGALARQVRADPDASGLSDVRIVAGGGLDEYGVDTLIRSGAPIDVHAVGTRVGASADAPYLDSAYKVV